MHILLVLFALASYSFGEDSDPLNTIKEHSANGLEKQVFLKYPSSYINVTSETWKTTENEKQLLIAVKFRSQSAIGQIFSIRFIRPDGVLEALLRVGISEGHLEVDLYNSERRKILNKPIGNFPIHVHEHNLGLSINVTSNLVRYIIKGHNDTYAEINQNIDISNREIVVTLGGGDQSMIGCASLVALSLGEREPVSEINVIAQQDIDNCPVADACTTRDCNTGVCHLFEVPVCDCYGTGMTGPNCRKSASTVKLVNNDDNEETSSYVGFNPPSSATKISRLSMDFKFSDEDSKEGILIHGITTNEKTFKIYVVGTRGKVQIQSIDEQKNVLDFELTQSDENFHSIMALINSTFLTFFVDGRSHRTEMSEALFFKSIHFGAEVVNGVVSDVGVTACIKNVYVDQFDVIDLVEENDPRVFSNRVRSCENGDGSHIPGVKLFSADPITVLEEEEDEEEEEESEDGVEDDEADDDEEDTEKTPLSANLFPIPAKTSNNDASIQCENSQKYLCQNGAQCKMNRKKEFQCFCRPGYLGKYCQFSTLPRSCAEAFDFLKTPDGPTRIDVDGRQKMEPSVVKCINGITYIDHDMPENTVVRSQNFQNSSQFIINYRDFKHWQLTKLMKNSGLCLQQITYRCNKAPLKFQNERTWFKSAWDPTKKILQMGEVNNSCDCIDNGCQAGEKCNCDTGAISEDSGHMRDETAGIIELVALRNEYDVNAEMSIGQLMCSGYEFKESPIRFIEKTEITASEWAGESIDIQFRTNEKTAILFSVRGKNDEILLEVKLLNGHTIQLKHLETVRVIESQNRISDSQWHRIFLDISDDEILFQIDASTILLTIGENVVLDGRLILSDQEIGFVGCMRSLRLNDVAVDIAKLAENKQGVDLECTSKCTPDFCKNGAKCYDDFTNLTPFCQCDFPNVHSDETCYSQIDNNSSVSFHGGFLKFQNIEQVLNSSIHFAFRTDQPNALLFFAHDQNYNFLQIHLSEEVNITLTLNNLNIVSKCTIRAPKGTEFGDMKWINVAVHHSREYSQLQVNDALCTIRTTRILSEIPISKFLQVHNSDIVSFPIGLSSVVNPEPFTILFIANVDTGVNTNDGSVLLAPRYDSPIPQFFGCLRGLYVNQKRIDLTEQLETLTDTSAVRHGCDVDCDTISCSNGGHCSVAWVNYDPTATKTTCDCSRTSYAGSSCTLDDGLLFLREGWLNFEIGRELSHIFYEKSSVPQIFKFAFSAALSPNPATMTKQQLVTIAFSNGRTFEVELNPNRTINVAITWENERADILNFDGDFADGWRHFFVAQFNENHATAVMLDSHRQDFPFKGQAKNLDLFKSKTVKLGVTGEDLGDDYVEKTGFEGCISNVLIDFQRGGSLLSFSPIGYLNNLGHRLHTSVASQHTEQGACAKFLIPNSLPVYQKRVEFPVWETNFERRIYRGIEDENGSNLDDSLFWIFVICVILLIITFLLCALLFRCCKQKIHHASPISRSFDEEDTLELTTSPYRVRQPSPPPKRLAASNYHVPNPNVDFNLREDRAGGDFNQYKDEEDELLGLTLRGEDDSTSEAETIRHIDDDNDDMVIVERPLQVNHLPQRVSSFRGDSTAHPDSPLYSKPQSPTKLIPVPTPVPPPRTTSNI